MSKDVSNNTGGNAPDASPAKSAKTRRIARANELLAERQKDSLPIWIRPPLVGPEYYSGLSRSKLYEGAAKGHFRSVSIREPGQLKGTRLFHLASVLAFIERNEAAALATAEGSAK